jgi:hypothetical protein
MTEALQDSGAAVRGSANPAGWSDAPPRLTADAT